MEDTRATADPNANYPLSDTRKKTRKDDAEIDLMLRTRGRKGFPFARGPYGVGVVDAMTEGKPEESVYGRIYYPTEYDPRKNPQWWPNYIMRDYIKGLWQFKNAMAHRWPSWAPKSDFSHHNLLNVLMPLCPQVIYYAIFHAMIGHPYLPAIHLAPLKPSQEKYPIIVFSHGLGCSRFLYSQICCDIASFGFIVAAVEHRDGSACRSWYYHQHECLWVDHRMVCPEHDEYTIRNEQAHFRADEVSRMLNVLENLNMGMDFKTMVTMNPEYEEISSKDGIDQFDWKMFQGKMALHQAYVIGHSFGGATALVALAKDYRLRLGIALDSWLYPIQKENVSIDVNQPILFINTESFRCKENLVKMATFRNHSVADRTSVYIQGSVHQNHLDFAMNISKLKVRNLLGLQSEIDPVTFMEINNNLILQYIWKQAFKISHPKVDQDLLKQAYRLIYGFEHDDVLPIKEINSINV